MNENGSSSPYSTNKLLFGGREYEVVTIARSLIYLRQGADDILYDRVSPVERITFFSMLGESLNIVVCLDVSNHQREFVYQGFFVLREDGVSKFEHIIRGSGPNDDRLLMFQIEASQNIRDAYERQQKLLALIS